MSNKGHIPYKNHHFKQEQNTFACGETAISSILSMYGMVLKIKLESSDGIEQDRIKKILAEYGIHTHAKYITWDKIRRRSIAYYPRRDHWITIEKVDKKNNRLYINDSVKEKAEWVDKEDFCDSWLETENTGYVIECRRFRSAK